MEEVNVCRTCLITDVRMSNLTEYLKSNMSFLINDKSYDSLPLYICYECKGLLDKFIKFKQKCELATEILLNITKDGIKVTQQSINQIDRSLLQSALTCNTNYIYIDIVENIKIKENIPLSPEKVMLPDDGVFSNDPEHLKEVQHEEIKFKKKKIKSSYQKNKQGKTSATKCNGEGLKSDKVALLDNFVITTLTLEEQRAQIAKRKETSNYIDSPYKCEMCYKGFLQEETWRNHEKQHDPMSGNLVCPVCGIRQNTKRGMTSHLQRHAKQYSCNTCQFVTQHLDTAKKHKQWHEGVTYKCPYCSEIFIKLSSQLSHVRLKHRSEHVCVKCGDGYVSERGLAMHVARMHSRNEDTKANIMNGKYYCDICDINFVSMVAKTRHTVTSKHHTINNDNDSMKDVLSSRKIKLRIVRRQLAKIRRKQHTGLYPKQCELCREAIPDRRHHWRHYQKCHQNIKYPFAKHNFICEICGKGFQGNAFLTYHQRRHLSNESARYNCDLCKQTYTTEYALRRHLKSSLRIGGVCNGSTSSI